MIGADVTYILCAYNHAAYVRDALESAFRQNYQGRIQFVLADDGSSDGTADMMDLMARARPELWVENVSSVCNRGLIYNLNRAIAVAKGDYIVFQSCDDVAHPDRVAKFVKCFEDRPSVQVCFFDVRLIDEKANVLADAYKGPAYLKNATPVRSDIVSFPYLVGANEAVRKTLFERFGVFEDGLGAAEDHQLSVLGQLGGGVAFVPETTLDYRSHSSNWSGAGFSRKEIYSYEKWLKAKRLGVAAAKADLQIVLRTPSRLYCPPERYASLLLDAEFNLDKIQAEYLACESTLFDGFYGLLIKSLYRGKLSLPMALLNLMIRWFGPRALAAVVWAKFRNR